MTESTDYEKIFRHRGASYHRAMVDFPGVRTEEFRQLFHRFPLSLKERIIDCPALGGYLESNITVPVRVESLDFCPQGDNVKFIENFDNIEGANRVVCLASSHHINDLNAFLLQLSQVLKTGGLLHLADVGEDSSIRYFLDDFVGRWTSTGHSGIWRPLKDVSLYSDIKGLTVVQAEDRECQWTFQSIEQMTTFCRLLFGLDLNPTDQMIVEALKEYVGLSVKGNRYVVNWKLTYVDFLKK
jgi:hypothetical protein